MRTVVIVILCLLYVISPIDLLPDFIPILGWIDDLGVIGIALQQVCSQTALLKR